MAGNKKGECCYQCARRHAGCHAACTDYAAERAARLEEYRQRSIDADITSAAIKIRKVKVRDR